MSSSICKKSICVLSRVSGLGQRVMSKLPHENIKNITVPKQDKSVTHIVTPEELKIVKESEILLVDPILISTNNLTQELPQLKWMQSTWAGIDSLVKSLDPSKPLPSYKITKFGGAFGPMMSEFVFAQIIALERGFAGMMNSQKQKSWDQATFGVYRPLAGLTLGILGVGDIGKHIAKIAKLFGMQVWGLIRTKPDAHPDYLDEYRLTDGLPELLSQCDYVCNVLPDTSSTTGVLSAGMLKHCKSKSPVFINVGRGNILSEADVVEALE